MAVSYTLAEAVEIIVRGEDAKLIEDIGHRYPVLTAKIAAVGAKAGENFIDFMSFIPDYITANKINMLLKKRLFGEDGIEGTEDDPEQPVKNVKKVEKEKTNNMPDYMRMPDSELKKIIKKNGLEPKSSNHMSMVAVCKAWYKEEHPEEFPEVEAKPKGKPGRPAAKKDEAPKSKSKPGPKVSKKPAEDDEDEDWDDDEDDDLEEDDDEDDEEEVPAKKVKAAKKAKDEKKAKKAAKDDDEDWEI